MTKFQRGELMEGWNDCPIPVPASNSGAPSASATLKARKRMYRLSAVGGLQNSSESSVASSTRSLMMPPIPSTLPPPATTAPKAAALDAQPEETKEPTTDFSACETKLRGLVESAEIPLREKEFFTKRLVDVFPSLALPHKQFISQVVDGIVAKEPSGTLKTRVLNYMMVNSGVSVWGVPLKKLVETLK
ncbi:hypothetical protein METBIDRAFT_39433 [Metschnikowia bicuspidata var. bicuspidata NRRL YB-4993]|uniref:Uncharacterized protein n=1 Tax=Metschnikowia bicuspidata var. bicuspidata NRRL YB-4993 TaxID=869754 RepID=A0A1A0HDU6_9ASCO|nr:hypothetical protein METBIDRAFT_39433 [Metschnikowia bicuspidata var. bicuspidata NRRL YB-4993]OBA22067.1 hypothetical protein METBIDRAFT_39433 [Metschnikowia bicuspidata var. bicuspidata NRRL YB-4993]